MAGVLLLLPLHFTFAATCKVQTQRVGDVPCFLPLARWLGEVFGRCDVPCFYGMLNLCRCLGIAFRV